MYNTEAVPGKGWTERQHRSSNHGSTTKDPKCIDDPETAQTHNSDRQ